MKKTMRFLSLAALALVGAVMTSCSNEDDFTVEPENKSNVVTLTTTVSLDGAAATTRALTSGGVKTFAEGEQIALVYTSGSSTAKAVSAALSASDITNEGKSATFTFTLENPNKTQNVTYIYPAAMAGTTGVNYSNLASQDGTLATLSSNLDLATYSGAWNGASLPSATLTNQLAFLAVTLKDADGSNEITSSITGVTVSDGTNTYTVSRSAAAGPIYVAIRPTTSANIDITANDGSQCYNKSLTSKTYAAGNGYNVSWRMAPAALNLTSPAVGQVIGNDGKNYNYASLPGGVTAVAKICYVSGSHGLALALEDEGTMNWSTAITTCAAHTPAFTGGTWLLASKEQWETMGAIHGSQTFTDLRDGFEGVGGTNLLTNYYWSCTEYDSGNARIYGFFHGDWGYDEKVKDYVSVRACLAW